MPNPKGGTLARRGVFDADAKRRFCDFFAEYGLITMAANAAGVCYQTVNSHFKEDEEFAVQYNEALQKYRDKIQAEIHRRAIEGVSRYLTTSKGLIYVESPDQVEVVQAPDGSERTVPKMVPLMQQEYSDSLLMFHAKRHITEYRERSAVDHNVTGGVLLIPSGMSAEQWKAENDPARKALTIDNETGKAVKGA